jgi:hypothetical protein
MLKACTRVTSTHLGHGTTESGIQQNEDIIFNQLYIPFPALQEKETELTPPPPFPLPVCAYHHCIFFYRK